MAFSIAANIVTGFLGSGKTTLLRHVLKNGLRDERVAVLVNEVADLGIDGKVLHGVNVDRIVELSNGCICCSGILQFGLAIQEIVETASPTLVLIESSGVSEVAPLVAEIRNVGLRTDAVITVVDAENVTRMCRESPLAAEQIREADFLVVNKTDLVDGPALARVEKQLERLNPRAARFHTRFGALETDLPFASSARRFREHPAGSNGHHHADHENGGFGSFVYREPGSLDRDRFERFLRRLPPAIYRAKGIVHFHGDSQPSLFNYVCGRFDFDWIALRRDERFTNQAVFIGRDAGRVRTTVLEALKSCHQA
jgi:G3E family GTPase